LLILSQPHSTEGKQRIVYVVAALSALGGMLFGYDTGVISGAILFIRQDFVLSDFTVGLVISAVLIGAVIGAALGGDLSDHFGRRKVIIVAAIIFALGAVGTATVPDVSLLILGRIAVGVAIGIASEVTPLYISEMSPSRMRGSLVSLNQLAITNRNRCLISGGFFSVGFSGMALHAWLSGDSSCNPRRRNAPVTRYTQVANQP